MRTTLVSVYRERDAAEVLYALLQRRAENPEMNISHCEVPSLRAHKRFMRSKPYRAWYLIKVDALTAGTIYATKMNEIGLHLFPEYQGQGVGRWALETFLQRNRPLHAIPAMRVGQWLANIHPDNGKSIMFFLKAGFKIKQFTYQL